MPMRTLSDLSLTVLGGWNTYQSQLTQILNDAHWQCGIVYVPACIFSGKTPTAYCRIFLDMFYDSILNRNALQKKVGTVMGSSRSRFS